MPALSLSLSLSLSLVLSPSVFLSLSRPLCFPLSLSFFLSRACVRTRELSFSLSLLLSLLQVHDELVFEVREQDQDAVAAVVKRVMEHACEPTHKLSGSQTPKPPPVTPMSWCPPPISPFHCTIVCCVLTVFRVVYVHMCLCVYDFCGVGLWCLRLAVPLVVDVGLGKTWASAH